MTVRCAKSDGASRTRVHRDLPTWADLVVLSESMVVLFDTKPNRSVFQLILSCHFVGLNASAGLEVDLATFGVDFVATTPGADMNHIGC